MENILVNRTNLVHNFFLNTFIAFLYTFRATMCPSSGENYRNYATSGICHSIWCAGWNEKKRRILFVLH